MSTKKPNLPNTFKGIHDEFHRPDPTRPKTATEAVNATYARGAAKIEQQTGRKVDVPTYDDGLKKFPPAKKMLGGGQ